MNAVIGRLQVMSLFSNIFNIFDILGPQASLGGPGWLEKYQTSLGESAEYPTSAGGIITQSFTVYHVRDTRTTTHCSFLMCVGVWKPPAKSDDEFK